MRRIQSAAALSLLLASATSAIADTPRAPTSAPTAADAPRPQASTPRPATAPTGVREVVVARPRVLLSDLVPGLSSPASDIDAGAAPPAQGARLVTRDEIAELLKSHGLTTTATIPLSTRVVRKVRTLRDSEIESLLREALERLPLRAGTTVATVRAPRSVVVADGWTRVDAELPKIPRREGNVSTMATLIFAAERAAGSPEGSDAADTNLARLSIPVTLTLGPGAAVPTLVHRSTVNLLVRRGLVEISTAAVAGADADVGEVFPVTVKATGKTLLARLLSADRAIAVETP